MPLIHKHEYISTSWQDLKGDGFCEASVYKIINLKAVLKYFEALWIENAYKYKITGVCIEQIGLKNLQILLTV